MARSAPQASALAFVLVAVLCGGPATARSAETTSARVAVALGKPTEYGVTPARRTVKAGKVTFIVTNKGAITHEMNVIRVPTTSAVLAKGKSAGQVLEKGKIAAVEGLEAGKTGRVTVTLQPGTYQLFCNIPGHYMNGMRTAIKVT